jgi:hypothetical protein
VDSRANLDRFGGEKISCPHTGSNPGSSSCNNYVILADKYMQNEYKALCSIHLDVKMKECEFLRPVVLTVAFAQCMEVREAPELFSIQ